MKFVAEYGGSAGVADNASDAWAALLDVCGAAPEFSDVTFYKAAEIKVEMIVQEKIDVQ